MRLAGPRGVVLVRLGGHRGEGLRLVDLRGVVRVLSAVVWEPDMCKSEKPWCRTFGCTNLPGVLPRLTTLARDRASSAIWSSTGRGTLIRDLGQRFFCDLLQTSCLSLRFCNGGSCSSTAAKGRLRQGAVEGLGGSEGVGARGGGRVGERRRPAAFVAGGAVVGGAGALAAGAAFVAGGAGALAASAALATGDEPVGGGPEASGNASCTNAKKSATASPDMAARCCKRAPGQNVAADTTTQCKNNLVPASRIAIQSSPPSLTFPSDRNRYSDWYRYGPCTCERSQSLQRWVSLFPVHLSAR